MNLDEAKAFVLENRSIGLNCPCCGQFTKEYNRMISSSMAIGLIKIGQYFNENSDKAWVHVQRLLTVKGLHTLGGEIAKLRYWGLIEEKVGLKDDNNPHIGFWRITEKGWGFLAGKTKVCKYVVVFDDRCYGSVGPDISIYEALKNRFDYTETVIKPAWL